MIACLAVFGSVWQCLAVFGSVWQHAVEWKHVGGMMRDMRHQRHAEFDATGANSIAHNSDLVGFARVCSHLGLLGDGGGLKFLLETISSYLDGWMMWVLLKRVVRVGKMRAQALPNLPNVVLKMRSDAVS